MIYRQNPALPPRAKSEALLAAEVCCEAVIRQLSRCSLFHRKLAEHLLDVSSETRLLKEVRGRANGYAELFSKAGIEVANVGSGRRNAEDRGGCVAFALEPWERSFRRVLRNEPGEGPADSEWLALWNCAHPQWASLFDTLVNWNDEWGPCILTNHWNYAMSKDSGMGMEGLDED